MPNLEKKWKIKFYLEKRKAHSENDSSDRNLPIYMYVTFGNGERLQFYAREGVQADQFDPNYLQKVKEDRHFFRPIKPQSGDSRSINGRLENLAKEAIRIIEWADKSEPPIALTADYLKTLLKKWLDKDLSPVHRTGINLSTAMDAYKEFSLLHHSPKTSAGFKQVRDNIEAYVAAKKIKGDKLVGINQAFVDGFETYLINKKVGDRHLSNNTYAKNLKVLKAFLKWCSSKGWYENSISIKYKENEGAILFLTQDEFSKLANARFYLPALERMRDVFIFGTMTGLRYGDIKGLKKNDFRDGRIWYYEQKKQATIERSIKLVPKALAIVSKYKDMPGEQLLPAHSDPNRILKDVFIAAKIERQVTIIRKYAGGKIEETVVPLSQVAHSHMGRKTFITLALTMGIPEVVLKSITGHSKDSDSFRRYYNIIDSMKDDAMDATFGKL